MAFPTNYKAFPTRPKKKRAPKKTEVDGPFRSQSSNPKIRSKATPHEHRKVSTVPPKTRKVRRIKGPPPPSPATKRHERKALDILRSSPPTPQAAILNALTHGTKPDSKGNYTKRQLGEIQRAQLKYLSGKEGLKEDPIAEFAISTAATAGVGGAASLAGRAGESAVAAGLARLGSSEATVGESAAEKMLKAALASESRSVPKRVVQGAGRKVQRIGSSPKRAKQALSTAEGRRAATAKELGKLSKAGSKAVRHPVRSTGAGYAVAPVAGVDTDTAKRANALATGTAKAVVENPGGTAEATGRGIIGAVTGPLALLGAGADSAATQDIGPLKKTATKQVEGMAALGGELLSGDSKKVQKAVEEDVGLSYLAPVPALTRLKGFKQIRSALRDTAQDVRRGVAGRTGSKRLRYAPKGVESEFFGKTENRAARKRVAKQVQRTTAPSRSQAAYHQKQILKELRKAPLARSLRNRHGLEAGDLLQTFAEYGIRNEKDVNFVREHGPVGEQPRPGRVTLKTALDFAESHPEILKDKHFKKALDAYIESTHQLPAAKAGKGRRARLLAVGDILKVTRPEDRVPFAARPYTDAATRAGAWTDLQKREGALLDKRHEARKLADQAQVLKGKERKAARDRSEDLYREVRQMRQENQAFYNGLHRYTRPGQKLTPSARRKHYDEELLKEYESDFEVARRDAGLAEPAWTHHSKFRGPGEIGPRYPTAAGRVEHMREGTLAEHDLVDRSLRALLSGSVVAPRLRAGGQELARAFTERESLPIKVDGKTKRVITADEWTKAVEDGQYSLRHYTLFPARQFKAAFADPFKSQADIAGIAGSSIKEGLREETPGSKYVVVKKEAAKEFQAQISPEHWAGEQAVNAVSKGVSRWLLFSPAWMMIQAVAEAIPMAMAHPELMSPVKLAKLERSIRKNVKLNPDEAKAFAAVAGEAPSSLRSADDFRPELDSNPHGIFSDGARAMTKSRLGQGLFSLIRLRPFGVFDNWRQGKYRELLLAAEADKQLNGWVSSLKQTLHIQKTISDELKGLPRHEQFAALTKPKYRKQLDEMADHVENIAGNWSAFTRFERSFAPFLVFYPFLRYSLRWPLTFAKQHPVSATIATFLGQQNAEQLDKILGHAPANPLAYAIPVWQDATGESHLSPTGQRAAPGLSAPTQAIASQKPSQALSVFNPLIGAGITALTGVNAYTGRQEAEKGIQAVNLLLETSPIARFLNLKVGEEPSVASKRFEQIDSKRKQRSLVTPWEGLSPRAFRESENFGSDLSRKYSDPIPQPSDNPKLTEAIYGKNGKGGWVHGEKGPLLKLIKEHEVSEKAAERVTAQEQPFYTDDKLTPAQEKKASEAWQLATGGIFIPTKKKKVRRIGSGIGGSASGGVGGSSTGRIGGYSLGGGVGGSSGIGGHPVGG